MSKPYKYPHSVINNYLADYLEQEQLLSKTVDVVRNGKSIPYGTIIGEEMVPEMAGAGVPKNSYIVFSIGRDDNDHIEYQKYETIIYQIFTKGKSAGMDIADGIVDCLGRRDFTTDDLMDFQIEQKGQESFHFFDVEYNTIGVAEAMNNGKEAGYYMGTIMIRYSYIYEVDKRGKRIKM